MRIQFWVALLVTLAIAPVHAAQTQAAAARQIEAATARGERPDAAAVKALAAGGAVLVDVRSEEEWKAGHARGAVFLPWRDVPEQAAGKLPAKDTPIVTYCAVGKRAAKAADSLRELGYTHVTAMTGGYDDLKQAGYPTE